VLTALSILVLASVLVLIVRRPFGLQEAVWTCAGAALVLLTTLVSVPAAITLTRSAASPLLFLISLLWLAALLEASGFFAWSAIVSARGANGDGVRLHRNVFLLGAAITVLLSLDTTAVILTPLVLSFVTRLRLPARVYIVTCAFVANTASLALPISNLTNLLFTDTLHTTFGEFALWMALPQIVALVVLYVVLRRWFRAELRNFDPDSLPDSASVIADVAFFRASIVVLFAISIGYFFAPLFSLEPYVVSFAGAFILTIVGAVRGRVVLSTFRHVSWSVVPFVIGLFIVVRAVENRGAALLLTQTIDALPTSPFARILSLAGLATLASNFVNNLPAALMLKSALAASHASPAEQLAALVGTNAGPNLTVIGSLATTLVLIEARKRGETVRASELFRPAIVVTPLVVVAASGALWLVLVLRSG
jgi:arsenical pump membrane protein